MSQLAQQPFDASGGVDLGLPVRAVNSGDTAVTWTYDRQKYVIAAHSERMVPYMAMCLYQGDPRSINVPGGRQHEQFRDQQLRHLRVLYGVYEESEGHNRWDEIPAHHVTCYPLDSDVPFNTVLRDPDGAGLEGQVEGQSQLRLMQDTMDRMAVSMRAMQAQIAQQEQIDGALANAGIDPDDMERQETTSRAASPEEATGQSMVGPSPTRRPAPKGDKAQVTRDGE